MTGANSGGKDVVVYALTNVGVLTHQRFNGLVDFRHVFLAEGNVLVEDNSRHVRHGADLKLLVVAVHGQCALVGGMVSHYHENGPNERCDAGRHGDCAQGIRNWQYDGPNERRRKYCGERQQRLPAQPHSAAAPVT